MTLTFIVIALLAIASALVSARITWRIVRHERLRSEARVAGLSAAIKAPRTSVADEALPPSDLRQDLFEETPGRAPRSAWMSLGGAVVAGVLLGIALTLGHSAAAPSPGVPEPVNSLAPGRDLPLELVALRDERQEGRLTIHGVIRNPGEGTAVTHVTAVVLLFNQQGGFLTSGRATIDSDALQPGRESGFAVTIPDAADVGRYRVSFRDDLRVIPHVDRRVS